MYRVRRSRRSRYRVDVRVPDLHVTVDVCGGLAPPLGFVVRTTADNVAHVTMISDVERPVRANVALTRYMAESWQIFSEI